MNSPATPTFHDRRNSSRSASIISKESTSPSQSDIEWKKTDKDEEEDAIEIIDKPKPSKQQQRERIRRESISPVNNVPDLDAVTAKEIGKSQSSTPIPPTRTRKKNRKKSERKHLEPKDNYEGDEDHFTYDSEIQQKEVQFVNLKDLQYQQKIQVDPHREQWLSSVHKYDRSLDGMRIRVQLIQYPSSLHQQDNSQDKENLILLEERIFTWQEKVFSGTEAEFLRDKKNLVTDLDFEYHSLLQKNRKHIGMYLFSYVETDVQKVDCKLEGNVTVRRCPAPHSRGQRNYLAGTRGVETRHLKFDSDSNDEYIDIQEPDTISPRKCFSLKSNVTKPKSKPKKKPASSSESEQKSKSKETKSRKKSTGNEEEDKEPYWETEPDSEQSDVESVIPKSTARSRQKESEFQSDGQNLQTYGNQTVRKPDRQTFYSKVLGKPEETMYIMASLPLLNRKKKDIVVGLVRTYPKAGVIVLKPSFGYQIVEPVRNQVFRLNWELDRPLSQIQVESSSKEEDIPREVGSGDYRQKQRFVQITAEQEDDEKLHTHDIFEVVSVNEFRVQIMGEILCAQDFEASPLTLHYFLELPKGWRNEGEPSSLVGVSHSAEANKNGIVHFCQEFCFNLGFSMDSIEENESYPRPILYFMIVHVDPQVVMKHEGYAYLTIPSQPGFHSIKIPTWKLKPSTIYEKLRNTFANICPTLQDVHAVYIPNSEHEECRRINRLGLQTMTSGSVQIRFHIIHQSSSLNSDQRERLHLLEKMNSATILKSVQTVIEAFQRARQKAATNVNQY